MIISFRHHLWACAPAVMRALLVLCGMPTAGALDCTPHSWRHLYLTLVRQLRLADDQLNVVGHWAEQSGMPRRHDTAACVSELAAKAGVMDVVISGWKLVCRILSQYDCTLCQQQWLLSLRVPCFGNQVLYTTRKNDPLKGSRRCETAPNSMVASFLRLLLWQTWHPAEFTTDSPRR